MLSHRCNVSSWIRDAVIRDRNQDKTLGSRDRDFEKRVSRCLDVSKYPPLLSLQLHDTVAAAYPVSIKK